MLALLLFPFTSCKIFNLSYLRAARLDCKGIDKFSRSNFALGHCKIV